MDRASSKLSIDADPILAAAAAASGRRPEFTGDPLLEHLFAMNLALVTELSVTRERLDSLERLLERAAILPRQQIESFEPTAADAEERGQWQQQYLSRVFRSVLQDSGQHGHGSPQLTVVDGAPDSTEPPIARSA